MKFRASYCDPFKKDIIELGEISKDDILSTFNNIDWNDHLLKISFAKEEEICYSPSLEIENMDNGHALSISAVGDPENYAFYIFYKRPKKVKYLFGLKEKIDLNFQTEILGQKKADVIKCLDALIKNDQQYLSSKINN